MDHMRRTITVKGVGSVSAKPDFITLSLSIETADTDYGNSARLAAERVESLQSAFQRVGFEKSDLKTTGFHVNTRYENQADEKGNYRRVFAGYVCVYRLKLSFDFDTKRLSEVLCAVSGSQASPELSIAFTVKDPAAIRQALLVSAAENARAKAEILCRASGAVLGDLVSIDYNWNEQNLISPTNYALDSECMPLLATRKASAPEITPDDIALRDTAAFVWEIDDLED